MITGRRPKPNTDTGGECLRGLQGGQGGAARFRPWCPRQPLPQSHNVQGRRCREMLAMGLGEPHLARLPEATPTDALRVGTLEPCPRRILLAELFRRRPLPGLLQRLIRLTCLEPYEAWLLLGPGPWRPVGTWRAVCAGHAHLPQHATFGIGVWAPGETLLAHRAGEDLALPIHPQRRCVTAGARAGLPTGVIGPRADARDPIRPLALHQARRIGLPLIHQVCGREPPTLRQGHLHALDPLIIRGGGGRRFDLDDHMGCVGLAGLRQLDFIAHPLARAFRAVPGLRVIGGGDAFRRGGQVFHRAPAAGAIDLHVWLSPDAAEGLYGGDRRPPGRLESGVHRLEQPLTSGPYHRRERLASGVRLRKRLVLHPMARAVIPCRGCQGL
jgi:hypothetical protein